MSPWLSAKTPLGASAVRDASRSADSLDVTREMVRSSSTPKAKATAADAGPAARGVGVQPVSVGAAVGGRYVVLGTLGVGAMGSVYSAYDTSVRREVALKILHRSATSSHARLIGEGRAMAALSHPNVVQIYDVAVANDEVLLAMEYVAGQNLARWLDLRPSAAQIVEVFVQAGRGLAAAHRVGLVHRDFKPANILLSNDGRVLVCDFGIAERIHAGSEAQTDFVAPAAKAGAGTPWYMAPEQHLGLDVDGRADQYAFCLSLWEALCGNSPFDAAPGAPPLAAQKLESPPAIFSSKAVSRRLREALRQGLEPDKERRHPSMDALLEVLVAETSGRRNRTVAVLAFSSVSLPVAWLWAWHAEREQVCAGAPAHLAAVWNAERELTVKRAFLQAGVAYAPDTWTRVEGALSRYAQQWARSYRDACRETASGQQPQMLLDLRMGCLHRRRVELGSVVDVLAQADAQVVEHAVPLVAALPSLDRCANIDALQAEVPPPEDPVDASKVEQATTWLSHAAAHERAGKYVAAQQALEQAADVLEGVEYAPVRAKLSLHRGSLREVQGDYAGAEEALQLAAMLALESGAMEDAATATASLARLVGDLRARLFEGLSLAHVAVALTDGAGPQAAHPRHALGNVLFAHGRYREAEAQHREALALWEQAYGSEHPGTAAWRNSIAGSLYAQGRYEEAQAEYMHVLAVRVKALGEQHPAIATTRSNLGNVLHAQGRYAEAESQYRDALELRESALGREHPAVAALRNNLAVALYAQGKHAEAEAEHRAALALWEKTLGSHHPRVAASRSNLALALHGQGHLAEAEAQHRHALDSLLALVGAEHPDVADSRVALASVLHDAARYAEAEVELRQALPVWEKTVGAEHPSTARAQHKLGRVLVQLGRVGEARRHLEQAWAVRSQPASPPAERAEAAWDLAQLLWRSNHERHQALALARQAHADFAAAGASSDEQRNAVERWLDRRSAEQR